LKDLYGDDEEELKLKKENEELKSELAKVKLENEKLKGKKETEVKTE
jgi:hypothetical protein